MEAMLKIISWKQKTTTNSKLKLTSGKEKKDISIVLLHAMKAGRLEDKDLFSRENSTLPPALTQVSGEMFHGIK